jgi:hypothetical protein
VQISKFDLSIIILLAWFITGVPITTMFLEKGVFRWVYYIILLTLLCLMCYWGVKENEEKKR